MAKKTFKPTPPAPVETLGLTDQVIWNDGYKLLHYEDQFFAKTIAASLEFIRAAKVDVNGLTADGIIEMLNSSRKKKEMQ